MINYFMLPPIRLSKILKLDSHLYYLVSVGMQYPNPSFISFCEHAISLGQTPYLFS